MKDMYILSQRVLSPSEMSKDYSFLMINECSVYCLVYLSYVDGAYQLPTVRNTSSINFY